MIKRDDIPLGFTYNSQGKELTYKDSGGYWYECAYDAQGNLLTYKNGGRDRLFEVDESGELSLAGFKAAKHRSEVYDLVFERMQSPEDLDAEVGDCRPLMWLLGSLYRDYRNELAAQLEAIGPRDERKRLEARLNRRPLRFSSPRTWRSSTLWRSSSSKERLRATTTAERSSISPSTRPTRLRNGKDTLCDLLRRGSEVWGRDGHRPLPSSSDNSLNYCLEFGIRYKLA